ncbi:hypothetical protein PG614_09925 [Riemerella anatipestifer]|nr:hypothetical protein [Riemerella anatipestifer]MDY3534283.1 hypothetical protein [Riemerella anatipestifer]MDY3536263.1 hypothetical protein [Riemerella anatipestifer]
MDKHKAKQHLIQSITNLQQRRGNITVADLETEVINNTCLFVLKNQKEKMRQGKTIEEMFLGALNSIQDFIPITSAFTEAAMELFPGQYTERHAMMATMGVQQNIAWEGMWDFLRDYFQKNHGIRIDDTETEASIFYSTKHKRYENGSLVSESEVERTINLNFIDNNQELVVSIEPSLSPKKSHLISNDGNTLKYKGYDPDYLFTVSFDDFEEVEQFILEMPNRNLKIVYFE